MAWSRRFLEARRSASLRRVLRTPERWPRIVALARDPGRDRCRQAADAKALSDFLVKRQQLAPALFAGPVARRGEAARARRVRAQAPGRAGRRPLRPGVDDYTHATAPNRRFPDVITQRLAEGGARAARLRPTPMRSCARSPRTARCRRATLRKWSAWCANPPRRCCLQSRIGQQFDAIVTGVQTRALGCGSCSRSPRGGW